MQRGLARIGLATLNLNRAHEAIVCKYFYFHHLYNELHVRAFPISY